MAYYTLSDITNLRDTAEKIGAEMPYYISILTINDIQLAANGVGPDSFPSIIRHILSTLLPYADVATMIHDAEFQFGKDSSEDEWKGANLRFYRNCLKRIKDLYGWYDPRRYINFKRAAADYALIGTDIGLEAWKSAKKKYNK